VSATNCTGNSPVYRFRREDYFHKQCFCDDRAGSTPIPHTVTRTVGISNTEPETYSEKVRLKISASQGRSLIGSSLSVELGAEHRRLPLAESNTVLPALRQGRMGGRGRGTDRRGHLRQKRAPV